MNLPPYLHPAAGPISGETKAVFFLAVPPPWGPLAAAELHEKLAALDFSINAPVEVLAGGLTVHLPLAQGLLLNHYLKIPSRLLLRLAQFRCRDFPTLYKKAAKIFWGQYINAVSAVEFSAHHSRLIDARKARKAVTEAVQASFKARPPKKNAAAGMIFVRLQDDQAEISLDTSGERLDRRAYRVQVGRAPLRENLAAAMLYFLKQNFPAIMAQTPTLFAPMCGAGTFITEAQSFYHPLPRPYAYQNWGCRPRLNIAPDRRPLALPALFASPMYGLDWDAQVLAAAQHNEQTLAQQLGEKLSATWICGDIFSAAKAFPLPLVMVLNPPYGRRLPLATDPATYFPQLYQTLWKNFRPNLLAMLLPPFVLKYLPAPTTAQQNFNGGQKTIFACWAK